MAYSPTVWENETPTEPPRYRIVDDVAGEIAASAEIEMVSNVVPGTPITAQAMNKIEQGIKAAHDGVAASAPAMFAAKGDLAVGTGPGAGVRLPVGANGHVLTANSAKTQGMEWAALPVAVPVGGIIMWSGLVANIPAGWALCNGLNGTPDLRGRFVIGAGGSYNPGNKGGAASLNLQHNHTQGATGAGGYHNHGIDLDSGTPDSVLTVEAGSYPVTVGTYEHHHRVIGNTQAESSHAHTNPATDSALGSQSILPPYYALCFIMRVA
jgi:hypothetical protein